MYIKRRRTPTPVILRNILIRHPERGKFLAKKVATKYEAAVMAGRAWGMSWVEVNRQCDFTDVEEAGPIEE